MNKYKKLIIANWKMNINLNEFKSLINSICISNIQKQLIICPPYPLISLLHNRSGIDFGAQDCSFHDYGSYTGDICAKMLADLGCKYVIVGHSERRKYHGETTQTIVGKIKRIIEAGLVPIVCIGEGDNIRTRGNYLDYLKKQIEELYKDQNMIIAYEPIWAIGSEKSASIIEIKEVINFISELVAKDINIIYGGSVNENNITEILNIEKLQGVLVGNASIKLEKLNKIIG